LGIIIKNIMSVIQMIILACLLGLVCSQSGGHYETIVIGGGIAGVTAAVEVAKSGQKVAILEANNYIGGRLKTTPVTLQAGGQVQFDEGASWIHGSCPENPIT
jgi:phytoene dehydrogenase-like protein